MDESSAETVETVETVATQLAARGESITVWVKADTAAFPRQGNAMCARIAALLQREAGATDVVRDPDESEPLSHDHTVIYTLPPSAAEADWWRVLDVLAGGRTVQPNVIIHAPSIPRALQPLKTLIDVRVTDPAHRSMVRLRPNDRSTESVVREEELTGLVGGA